MAILLESLISKIMTYVSHPVADLFKKHVSILPGVIEKDPDVILIGIHDGNHMYEDNQWFSKEHECQHYSDKIEEQIASNKLEVIEEELETYCESKVSKHGNTIHRVFVRSTCNRHY
jgi:hypothetical protein